MRVIKMKRKKDDSSSTWIQMELPFGNVDSSENRNNIVSFSSKVKELRDREELDLRKKSINRQEGFRFVAIAIV